MKTIHKFTIKKGSLNAFTIELPEGAQFLSTNTLYGYVCLWFLLDPEKPKVDRTFRVIGTGWEIEETNLKYLGTVLEDEGAFVWHIFETTPKKETSTTETPTEDSPTCAISHNYENQHYLSEVRDGIRRCKVCGEHWANSKTP